jgi:DNA replication licensing factor MCM3
MEIKINSFKILVFKNYFFLFLKKYNFFYYKMKKSKRILFSLKSLWKFSPFIAQHLLKKPLIYFPIIESCFNEFYNDLKLINKKKIKIGIHLDKSIEKKFTSPRLLSIKFIGEIIFLQGLVVNCSQKKVKLIQSVYFSPKSEKMYVKKTIKKLDNQSYFKKILNTDGQYLEIEYGLSTFIDCQHLIIQDLPEIIDQNESPCIVKVILEDELVNTCKIGQRVKLCGIYQPLEFSESNIKSNFFSANIKCLSISSITDNHSLKYFKCDMILMKNFSLLIDSFDRLASLICPNIFGELLIKKGIILFLTGKLNNSIVKDYHAKENINILLVGDSCTHKTNFLRCISNFYPNSVYITLANNSFNELNNRKKETIYINTNKLVDCSFSTSDNSIFCIDGLENVSELDKYLLSSILNYQNVYIPTGNFTFNSAIRSKLIAAANSIFGNYNSKKTIQSNINLEKSFLSKFDLIFLLLDSIDIKKDKKLANFLINNNYHLKQKKFNFSKKKNSKCFVEIEKFSIDFLKIYLNFSKNTCFPKLEDETVNYILKNYIKIRIFNKKKENFKINYIETLIRLTILYVKINLRSTVKKEDVKYMNDYLIEITKNNKNKEHKIISKTFKVNRRKDYSCFFNLKQNFLLKSKIKSFYFTNNDINILKKFYQFHNIISIMDFKFSFFIIKKNLGNRQKNSFFERTLSEWLKNEKCIIFKKIIIRI